jgi:hypothetical protein
VINAIEKLLGSTYEEISTSDILLGISIPDPEVIDLDSYVEIPAEGVSFVLPRGERVTAVQLYSAGRDGYSEFAGAIPKGLSFSMSREAVRAQIGKPQISGEATTIAILGKKPAWDKFDVGEFSIHVEYSPELDKVGLITLSLQKT